MQIEKIPGLITGIFASVQKKVAPEDTALNIGCGSLKDLLATPTLTALMIEASIKTVEHLLPDRYITVGKVVQVTHINPTIQGMTVTVSAKLAEIDHNRLVFEIEAYDELGLISSGTHERIIVNYDTFMAKVNSRCKILEAAVK